MYCQVKQATLPWPEHMGPFRLHEPLGRGGMGVVSRAKHERTGEFVALKSLTTITSGALTAFRREIRLLTTLRHPNIVHLVNHGIDRGRPWYAMELLDGPTLKACMGPWTVTETGSSLAGLERFSAIIDVLRQLCAPISYLHDSGIVHRDIKPENIILRLDGTAVLCDFGSAGRFGGSTGRETLEVGGRIVGTAEYMAPEQIRGELVDARADLYALGCILYQGLTGQPPFAEANRQVITEKKLRSKPPPPSELADEIPMELERLALGLLEPKPRNRIGDAHDVALVLDSVVGRSEAPPNGARPYFHWHRADFVGREAVLEELKKPLLQAERADGAVVFIGGERGMGKTRLAMELGTIAAWRGFSVITGECQPMDAQGDAMGSGVQLRAFRPLFCAIADRRQECEMTRAHFAERIADHESWLEELHVGALHSLPDQPDKQRVGVIEWSKDLILAFAELDPLLVVLDDLQWADDASLDLLEALSNQDLHGRQLLILGTYRSDEARGSLRRTVEHASVKRFELEPMGAPSLEAMLCGMMAVHEPPRPLSERIVHESQGNPRRVGEGLRTAMDAGLLRRDVWGQWKAGGPKVEAAASLSSAAASG